eukprot:GEMP01003206.1.p1 GENE.GEMP01003206.1~~GEMP01003206.1.p1  ORF type:complete len:847 (+),score=257.07 GEMP01003206.1:171-2711(+)
MTSYSSPRTDRRIPLSKYHSEYDDEVCDADDMGPAPPQYYARPSRQEDIGAARLEDTRDHRDRKYYPRGKSPRSKSGLRRRPQSMNSSAPSYGYRAAPREMYAEENDSYGYEGDEYLNYGPPGMGGYKKSKSRVWSNSGYEKNASPSARSRQKSVARSDRNVSPSGRSRQKSVARSERSNPRHDDGEPNPYECAEPNPYECAEPNPYEHDIRRDAHRSVTMSGRHGIPNGDTGFDEMSGASASMYESQSSGSPRRLRDGRRPMDMMIKSYHEASYTDLSQRSNDYDRKSREEVLLMKKVYMTRQRHEQAVLQLEKIQGHNYPYYQRSPSQHARRTAGESPRRMRLEDGSKRKYDYRHDDFVSSSRTPSTHLDFRSSDSTDAPYHMRPYRSRGQRSSRDYYDECDMDDRHDDDLYAPSSSTRKNSRHHSGSYHSRNGVPTPFRNESSRYQLQLLEPITLDALPAGRSSVSYSRPAPPAPAAPKSRKLPTPVKEEEDDEEWVTEILTVPNYTSTHPYVPPHDTSTPSHSSRARAVSNGGSDDDDDIVDVRRLTIESSYGGGSYTQHVLAQQEQHRHDHRLLPVEEEASQNTSYGWHNGEEPDFTSEGRLTTDDLTPARLRAPDNHPAQERQLAMYQQQPKSQMSRDDRDQLRAERKKRLQQDASLSAEEQRSLFATLGKRRDDSGLLQQQFSQQAHDFNQAEQQRYEQQQQQFAQQRQEQDDEHNSGNIEDRLKRIDTLVLQAQTLDNVRRRRLASKVEHTRQTVQSEATITADAPSAIAKLKEDKRKQMQAQQDTRRHMERLRAQRLEEKLLGRQPNGNKVETYQTLAPGESLPLVTNECLDTAPRR